MERIGKTVMVLLVLSLAGTPGMVLAGGGAEPDQRSRREAARVDRPTATPVETEAALDKARQAVPRTAPQPPAEPAKPRVPSPTVPRPVIQVPTPAAEQPAARESAWLIRTPGGDCRPLASLQEQTGGIGSFGTPEEFAHNLRQRGHQTFLLPLDEDQVRVKVPSLDLQPLFVKSEACR